MISLRTYNVHKFGGTSLGNATNLSSVRDIVQAELRDGVVPVLVVSALSNGCKRNGTTSTLLRLGESVLRRDVSAVQRDLASLRDYHCGMAACLASDAAAQHAAHVRESINGLELLLDAAMTIGEVTPRTLDIIVSYGERLAASFVAAYLMDCGILAEAVDTKAALSVAGWDETHLEQAFYDRAAESLADAARAPAEAGRVPVVTGFFGPVPGSLLRQIGRGYTDLTAALVARGLSAGQLTIWKEVHGVFSADPSKVAQAALLRSITPEEAAELTHYGAEVIHPFTMKQAVQHGIAIRIRDVRDTALEGTIVLPESQPSQSSERPSAVTIKEGIVVLNVSSKLNQSPQSFFADIFQTLARRSTVVDLIATSRVDLSMAIPMDPASEGAALLIKDLSRIANVAVKPGMAIVSLIGKGMRHHVGMSAEMFSLMAAAGVNIEMISQGASEINISCVVTSASALSALRAIHDGLLHK